MRNWRGRTKIVAVAILIAWQIGLTSLLTVGGASDSKLSALAKMVWGLNLLWIAVFGGLSLLLRNYVADAAQRLPRKSLWAAFSVLATVLALLEEAITTAMTNCAPIFGVQLGEVYITASANYLDVIFFHSVVVFIPQFAAWGLLLQRYKLSPFVVFVCYGLTGFVNEALFSGPNPLLLAQWILVYGLLVYLPAHLFRSVNGKRIVAWWLYPLLVVAPILASLPVVAILLLVIAPGHPSIHFPPM